MRDIVFYDTAVVEPAFEATAAPKTEAATEPKVEEKKEEATVIAPLFTAENALLSDLFYRRGENYDEFVALTEVLSEATKSVIIDGRDIEFLSLCEKREFKGRDGKTTTLPENSVAVRVISQEYLDENRKTDRIHYGSVDLDKFGRGIADEAKGTSGLFCLIGDNKYAIRQEAVALLARAARVIGEATTAISGKFRDYHLAEGIYAFNPRFNVIYREATMPDGRVERKILNFLGADYRLIPQTIVPQIVDKIADEGLLGDISVASWEVDPDITSILLEMPDEEAAINEAYSLPEKAKPFLYVATSDTGASSITVRGVVHFGDKVVVTDELKKKHTKGCNPGTILKEAEKDVFKSFRKLPETLVRLCGTDITDYSTIDLTTKAGQGENKIKLRSILQKAIKSPAFSKTVSARDTWKEKLIEAIVSDANPTNRYTYYDVAMIFASLPKRLDSTDENLKDQLQRAAGKIPYTLEKFIGGAKETEEEVILLPD